MEFVQTWKERVTPSGHRYSEHTARGHRTSANGSTGWPRPKSQEDGRTLEQYESARQRGYEARKGKTAGGPASAQGGLAIASQLAGWPTPMAGSPGTEDYNPAGNTDSSRKTVALLSGWNTPRATDGSNGGPGQTGGALPADAALAGWATPSANTYGDTPETHLARKRAARKAGKSMGLVVSNLNAQVHLASPRATPTSRDHKDGACQTADVPVNGLLGRQAAMLASGQPTTFCHVGTASGGVLNPEHSRWLMGLPQSWHVCGRRAFAKLHGR